MSPPSITLIRSTLYHTCQPCYSYTHGKSPLNRFETKVAMMPINQGEEAYRLNIGQNFGGM